MNNELFFGTGAVESPFDHRDVALASVTAIPPLTGKYLENIDDLPVWYQRRIGACVGHAAAKYNQQLDKIETREILEFSPRFLYSIAKCRDKVAGEGTYPRLVAGILKDHGCATEKTVKNDTTLDHEAYVYNRDESKVPKEGFTEAEPFKIAGYAFPNVKVADELGRAVKQFHGAILLMQVGEEWWTKKEGGSSWNSADIVPLRAPKNVVSGHEVYLYGYEVEEKTNRVKFFIFNSWSTDWGLSGKAWFYHDEYAPFLTEAITFVDLPNEVKSLIKLLPTKETFSYTFKRPIMAGERGDHVTALQTALMLDGSFNTEVYKDLFQNKDLGFYGTFTRQAVYNYQVKHNIAPLPELKALNGGRVGEKTVVFLNSIYSK